MKAASIAILVLACVTEAMGQIGVRTIFDYATDDNSNSGNGATTMRLTKANTPKRSMAAHLVAEDEKNKCNGLTYKHWLPTDSDKVKASCFWLQPDQEYVKYARFVGSSGNVAATTEILTDAIYGARVYVTTAVSSQSNSTTDAAQDIARRNLNLLAASGGNLSVAAAYPLYASPLPKNGGKFLWNTYGRAASTLQQLGIPEDAGGSKSFDSKDLNGNIEGATEVQIDLLSAENKVNILAYGKFAGIFGTQKFADALGASRRRFIHHQAGVGIRLADLFSFYVTWNKYSDKKIPGSGAVLTVSLGK